MRVRGTHWPLTILSGGSSVLNFLLPLVMSRKLDPAVVGEFKFFFLYLGIMPVFSLGVGFVNGTYVWGADPVRGPAQVRRGLLLCLAASLTAGALATIVAFLWGAGPYALIFGLATPPAVSASIYEASLIAHGRTRGAAWFALASEVLRIGLMLACLMNGLPLITILWAHTAASWLKLVIGTAAIARNEKARTPADNGEILRYAIPVSGASVFDLLIQNADRYLLAFLLSAPQFALYTFGCLSLPPAFIFEQSVCQVLIPRMAGEPRGSLVAAGLYRTAIEELLLFLLPLAALLMALAEPLIQLLFTNRYAGAAGYLVLYAPYYALMALPPDAFARARGDSAWILRTSVWAGLLSAAASAFGAWIAGPMGALTGFLVGQATRRAYGTIDFARREGLPLGELFPFRSAGLLAFSAAAAGVVANVTARIPGPVFLRCVSATCAFGAVYLILAWALCRGPLGRIVRVARGLESAV